MYLKAFIQPSLFFTSHNTWPYITSSQASTFNIANLWKIQPKHCINSCAKPAVHPAQLTNHVIQITQYHNLAVHLETTKQLKLSKQS